MNQAVSFVASEQVYRQALEDAGFRVNAERGAVLRVKRPEPPGPGLQILLGEQAANMGTNLMTMLKDGLLEPVALLARA
jgi:hypothetical protein